MAGGLTQERLKQLFHYDPLTGIFTRLTTTSPRAIAGDIAGCQTQGYTVFRVDGTLHRAHRLAWLYMTGEWATDDIDHRNRVRSDNRWVNLRAATRGQNLQNSSKRKDNKCGITGVDFDTKRSKWRAQIAVDKRHIHLGRFDTKDAAALAYRQAKAKLHQFNPEMRGA